MEKKILKKINNKDSLIFDKLICVLSIILMVLIGYYF